MFPEECLGAWRCNVGPVKLFRTRLEDLLRHYVVCLLDAQGYTTFGRLDFQKLHDDQHWGIDQYHRLLKQLCNVERFQVRGSFEALQEMQFTQTLVNAY